MDKYKFLWTFGGFCDDETIKKCSKLFSEHYGQWSKENPLGLTGNVKLSESRIRDLLCREDTCLYYAVDIITNDLVGYAIALRTRIKHYGVFSWVTQLVVHTDHRNKGIAKKLLFSIWGLSNDYAWGIITSNPYAVRALEKATRRRSIPIRIKKKIDTIIDIGSKNISYINESTKYVIDNDHAKVDTRFYVSHDSITEKLMKVISEEKPWLLGELDEGWEWIAFTFNCQEQISLSKNEIQEMIESSQDVVKLAYSRMNITKKQMWMQHTNQEVSYIIEDSKICQGGTVIDFGCGSGRHSIAFKELGYNVIAVDYVEQNIENLKCNNDINAILADCRNVNLEQRADVILCLYDVVGSFTDIDDNISIIKNIYNHLKLDGVAYISVMNFELTSQIAKNRFSFNSDPNALLCLPASDTMEKTGDIFNPEYMLVDDVEKIVYRKEQFQECKELPIEMIVRDRRFTKDEIVQLCSKVGFFVEYAHYVSASNWNDNLESTDLHAKEILLKCKKRGKNNENGKYYI